MGLFVNKEDEILEDSTELMSIRRADRIEVWDCEGELCYGCLPLGSTTAHCKCLIAAYQAGSRAGEAWGMKAARQQIRKALGID